MSRFPFLCLSVAVLVACGERPLEPRDPTPGVAHVKVATFNVLVGMHDDAETVEAVGATGADLIFLQEISNEWSAVLLARYGDDYPYQVYYGNGNGGLGTLSRWPVYEGPIHLQPNGWHPAWSLEAETPMGRIAILNVHLRSLQEGTGGLISDISDWDEDHELQIRLALSEAPIGVTPKTLPALVVGDFNEAPDGDSLDYLESLGFRNALPLFRPGQFTWRHPSLGNQFNESLDHILFDEAFVPLNAYVVSQGNSDHIPVVAHLEAASGIAPQF